MHSIEIPEANIKRYIPSHLGECTAKEYIDMCELIFRFICNDITYEELRVLAVYKLMNMVPVEEVEFNDKKKAANETRKYANIYLLSELIDGFFEISESGTKTIRQDYINNPVPKYKPLWRNYYGPTDSFINVKAGEYLDALRLFYEFNTTGEVELLYHIAAILYRPKKMFYSIKKYLPDFDGDMRVKYNANHVEDRVAVFKKTPYGFVYGVYLLFASFQKFVSTAEVSWAGRTLDLSILFTNDDNEPKVDIGKDDVGMDAVMFTMAESGVFGTLTELNNTSIWMLFVRMYDTRVNDLKLKKIQEDAKVK